VTHFLYWYTSETGREENQEGRALLRNQIRRRGKNVGVLVVKQDTVNVLDLKSRLIK